MKPDSQIREEILQELRWEPQLLDPDAIGVAVRDGAVTLTGSVSTYAQKLAAVRAASRVYGVKAVAGELKLKLAGAPQDDSDIAQPIPHVLEWSTQIPEGKVHAQVRTGWVTLDGEVEWDNQRHEVERMVRHVRGVVGGTASTETLHGRPGVGCEGTGRTSRKRIAAVVRHRAKRLQVPTQQNDLSE